MVLKPVIKRLFEQRTIFTGLVIKNLKDKYIGSFLGILWAVITPVLITLAVGFVFTQVIKTEMKDFHIFVLSGLLPWFFLSNSVFESVNCLRQNSDILNQFSVSIGIIPLSVITSNFLNFLIGFFIMLPLFIFFNTSVTKCVFLLPFILFLFFLFVTGIGLAVSVVNVYFRDMAQVLNVGMMFLMWITPVFYPLSMIPQKYRWFTAVNPGTGFISVFQDLLYRGKFPEVSLWLSCCIFSSASLILGCILFFTNENDVLKQL